MMRRQDQTSRALCELSTLLLNLLRSPPLTFPDEPPVPVSRSNGGEITAAGFASLVVGICLALMVCGWVTFMIGFMLMPWVIGLGMVFFVAGILSTISVLGRSILCYATAPTRKDIPAWKLL